MAHNSKVFVGFAPVAAHNRIQDLDLSLHASLGVDGHVQLRLFVDLNSYLAARVAVDGLSDDCVGALADNLAHFVFLYACVIQ